MNIKNLLVSRSVLFWQCAAFFLFSLHLAERIILSLVGQESAAIIWQFVGYILVVLFLQTVLCVLCCRFVKRTDTNINSDTELAKKIKPTRKKKIKNQQQNLLLMKFIRWRDGRLSFAAFLTFNTLGLFLSYTIFAGLGGGLRLLILLGLFGILTELFLRGGRTIFIVLTLLLLSANAEIGFQLWQKTSIEAYAGSDNWRDLFAKKFQETPFTKKPNVYIFSWDALAPESIAEEYLQIPKGVLAYSKYLNNTKNGFRVFKNVFTDRTTTPSPQRKLTPILSDGSRVFHNSLLFLDPLLWETQPGDMDYFYKNNNYPGQFYYFTGHRPSPLYEIFKENGYKILVSYLNNYFGKSGRYIDRYLIPQENDGQCNFGLPWFHFQSLGFCQIRRQLVDVKTPHSWDKNPRAAHVLQVLQQISRRDSSEQPWLSFVYFNSPGHTNLGYLGTPSQKENFRQYLFASSQDTAIFMNKIKEVIRRDDPQAIILFVGDHGYALRRSVINKSSVEDEAEKRLHVLDGHAVVGAISPADVCESQMNFPTKYITISMLVRAIVVCLAGGKDPVNWEVDYGAVYSDAHLNDYLYE